MKTTLTLLTALLIGFVAAEMPTMTQSKTYDHPEPGPFWDNVSPSDLPTIPHRVLTIEEFYESGLPHQQPVSGSPFGQTWEPVKVID